jgi:DNA primase
MPRSQFVDFKTVKTAVSILKILDHYKLTDTFKRNGDRLPGPCPLHGGQSPTQFRVSLSKNCWNCFSECKHGGNILDFVSRKEGTSIREAAKGIR